MSTMMTIISVVLSIFSSPSKPKTAERRQEFQDIVNIPIVLTAQPIRSLSRRSEFGSPSSELRPRAGQSVGEWLLRELQRKRDELLKGEIFYTLKEAKIVIENWRRHYRYDVRLRMALTIVNPNNNAALVTNFYPRADRQSRMRSSHSGAVYAFAICGLAPAAAIRSAIDTCGFSACSARRERY
jgi:hypothetical protein